MRTRLDTPGGEVEATLPKTAEDVLEWSCFVAVTHDHAVQSDMRAYPGAVASVIEWVAAHIDKSEDWVDERLTLAQAFALGNQIVDRASLPEATIDGITEWAKVVGAGGCNCPRCEDLERYLNSPERDRRRILTQCKFGEIDEETYTLVAMTRTARKGDLLKGPWWLYQIDNAVEVGRHLGQKQKDKRKRGKERLQQSLGKKAS